MIAACRLVRARIVQDDDPVRLRSDWRRNRPTASSRKPSALKLTMITPTVGAFSPAPDRAIMPTGYNRLHRRLGTLMKSPTHFQVTSHTLDAALRYRAVFALLADRWQPASACSRWAPDRAAPPSGPTRDRRRRPRLRAHVGAQAPEPDRASRQRHGDPDARRELRRGALPRHARARAHPPTGRGRSPSSRACSPRAAGCC